MFDLLEQSLQYCPNIIRNFLRNSTFNSLENAGGNFETRLQGNQIRDPKPRQVIHVQCKESRDVVMQWMLHLTDAITTLESPGTCSWRYSSLQHPHRR